jgi:LTXXQ motif family protein
MATLDHASRCLTSVSSPLIHRAAIILAVPAPVSLALRELASNRVPPAAPTAPLAIAASHHPARSAIGTCRPRAAWRIDTHPCRPNRSASPDLRASPGTHKRRPRMDRPASVRAPARPIPQRPCGSHQHPDCARQSDHEPAFKARSTAAIVSGRIAAMRTRVDAMLQAVQVARPALDKFYQSLSDEQKERFNVIDQEVESTDQRQADIAGLCQRTRRNAGPLLDRTEHILRLSNNQDAALKDLKEASAKAADLLKASCGLEQPITPSGGHGGAPQHRSTGPRLGQSAFG